MSTARLAAYRPEARSGEGSPPRWKALKLLNLRVVGAMRSLSLIQLGLVAVTPFVPFVPSATAAAPYPLPPSSSPDSSPKHHKIYQFEPAGTWAENLAVRANGNLLVTLLTAPELWEIPPHNPSGAARVHRFENYTSLLGITEYAHDAFAVVHGIANLSTGAPVPGSFAVSTVDFSVGGGQPLVQEAARVPEALLLNGLATLSSDPPIVLAADSSWGKVYRIDINSKTHSVALADGSMESPTGTGRAQDIGVNGIHLVGDVLYFTNTIARTLNKVRLANNGSATGNFTLVANLGFQADDFTLAPGGRSVVSGGGDGGGAFRGGPAAPAAYVAGNSNNTLFELRRDGVVKPILGAPNETVLQKPTAVQFGRTPQDRETLYVVDGTGQVVAVEL